MNLKQKLKAEMEHYQDSDPEKSARIKAIVDYIEDLEEELHKERIHRISDVQTLEIELMVHKNKIQRALNILSDNKEKIDESKGS